MFSSWGRGQSFERHFGVLWAAQGAALGAVPCRGGGPQPPVPRGRERAPLPPYGCHERGSVRPAAPLAGAAVWLRHEKAFQEGLRPPRARKPEPGGGSPRPDAQCPSVPGTWGGPPVSPPRGATGLGERDVPQWRWVEGARVPHELSDWTSPAGAAAVRPALIPGAPVPGGPIPGARSLPVPAFPAPVALPGPSHPAADCSDRSGFTRGAGA